MKKIIIVLCLLLYGLGLQAQTLTKGEYFFDTAPAIGSGTSFSFTAADTVTQTINVSISSLSLGFHTMYVRVMNSVGLWSHFEGRLFYIIPPLTASSSQPAISSCEWFVDTDPGFGNGTSIAFSSSDTVNQAVNLSMGSLSSGFHYMFIRVKNAIGIWSTFEGRLFYVIPPLNSQSQPKLSSGEWFIDSDPGIGNATTFSFTQADTVNTIVNLNTDSLPLGTHRLYIRVKNTAGHWGDYLDRTFNVCTIAGALADFNYVQDNRDLNFSSTSQNVTRYHWNFGNGDTSNIANPFHSYVIAGIFNTCLTVFNVCTPSGNTLCETIDITGLNSISPNIGGNAGAVTVEIKGGGFFTGTKFKLKKIGEADIEGDTLLLLSHTLMRTTLNLTGVATGYWDVEVITPTDTLILPQGFEVISSPNDSAMAISIVGNTRILRFGFSQKYTLICQNKTYNDFAAVPIFITGLPPGSKIKFVNPEYSLDNIPAIDSLNIIWDSIPTTFLDSTTMRSFTAILIPRIIARSSETIQFTILPPTTTPLGSHYTIEVFADKPLLASTSLLHRTTSGNNLTDCYDGIVDFVSNRVIDFLDLDDWNQCATGLSSIFHQWVGISSKEATETAAGLKGIINLTEEVHSGLELIRSCASASFGTIVPETKLLKITKSVLTYWEEFSKVSEAVNIGLQSASTISSCIKAFKQRCKSIQSFTVVNSFDPNEKYGPGSGSNNHFLNLNEPYFYTIGFQNDTTANAAAQTVTVIDTLDKTKFDVSTFGFTSVTIGDTSIEFGSLPKSFIRDFDFIGTMGVKARVTAHIDTTKGIITWVFNTIDPTTNQITENVLDGFLPPDTASPKGQGYVSYTVKTKEGLQTGDIILNRATIIFDFNPPIYTGVWQNIVDIKKPHSEVGSLLPVSSVDSFLVSWSGSDTLSGVRDYSVYVSTNGGMYLPWLVDNSNTSSYFHGAYDSTYAFYSIAADSAGNIEDKPLVYDAITQIVLGLDYNPTAKLAASLYPNPNNGSFNLKLFSNNNLNSILTVTNILGEILLSQEFEIKQGINNRSLKLSDLPSGIFNLKIKSREGEFNTKFVKE
ncbi:MAG: T9SS type A sorting domain-containing protein [Bacteroidetes bacterium]|nr:T9SS type A sorting domain-containing protein [Bacteroidota bacterium]